MQTKTQNKRNSLARFALLIGLVWLSVSGAGPVDAKGGNSGQSTYVGSVTYSVSPQHPGPGDPFDLTVTFHGAGHGQPCDISNIRATIQGVTQAGAPQSGHTHPPSQSTLTSQMRFSGVESGSLVPTISYDTLQRNGKTACDGGSSAPITPEGNTDPPSVKPSPEPALGITKALSGSTSDFVPGEVVTYRIVVVNSGEGDASNLTISDQLSASLLFIAAPGATSTPAVGASGTVQWTLASLTSQDSHEFSVTARVADDAPEGALSNRANVTAGSQNKNSNSADITVHRDPNVLLKKTVNGPSETGVRLTPGSIATYEIRYNNVGLGDASNVVITDILPAEIVGTPSLQGGDSQSWDAINRTASWTINSLDAGAGSVVTASGQVDPALGEVDFNNQASVSWTGGSALSNVANILVKPEPKFSLSKISDSSTASPGDRIHNTVAFENNGATAADNAVIKDYLPAAVTPVAGSFGQAVYDTSDNTLTWSLGRIEPGEVGTNSYAVEVSANAPSGQIVNIATLTATNLPSPLQASASTEITVQGAVDLVVYKVLEDAGQNQVVDGSDVTYRIWVENRGNAATEGGITLTDVIPPHLTYSNTSQSWTLSQDQSAVSLAVADLPAGGRSGTYLLTLRVDGTEVPDGAVIDNRVEASNTTQGVDYNHISEPARVYYNLPAKITLTKTATPGSSVAVSANDVIDYTLTVKVDSAQGVTGLEVGDVLPIGLTFDGSIDAGSTVETLSDGRQLVRWPAISLPSGERQYHLRARVDNGVAPGTDLTNTGLARYNGALERATVTHYVTEASISLTKQQPVTQAQIIPGDVLRYEITYTNTGKAPLTGITVTDNLPDNTALEAANPSPTSTTNNGSTLVWQMPNLDPGRSNTIALNLSTSDVQIGSTVTNQAFVTTAQTLQQSATASSMVMQTPELVVEKTAQPATAYPGDTVNFTLTYRNIGQGDATNVTLIDRLPLGLGFLSASGQKSPDGNGVISWDLGTLKSGASGTKIISLQVPANGQYVPATEVENVTELVSSEDAAADSAKVVLTQNPSFTIEEHEGTLAPTTVGIASPGDTLHYVVDVEKSGGAATGVLLAELLPDHTTYVQGSANYPIDTARSDIAAGLLVWDVGSVRSGVVPGQITFDAVIDPVVADGTRLTARAGVASNETGSQLSNEVVTEIRSAPVFSLVKSASKQALFSATTASGAVSDSLTYYLKLENQGDADATNVVVVDHLPAQLVIDPASTTGTIFGQTVTWTIPVLEVGVPVTLSVTAAVAKDVLEGTRLLNSANLTTSMPGVGGAVSNEVEVLVTGEPVLSVTKSASAKSVAPGDEFNYIIAYENTGTQVSAPLRIEDPLPDYVSFVSATRGGTPDPAQSGTVVWDNLAPVGPGAADSVEVTVRVDAVVPDGTRLPNTVTLSPTTDPTQSIPSIFEGQPPVVSSGPVLELIKQSMTGDSAAAGDVVVFSISVANHGSADATNLNLVDTLPPGLTLLDASGQYTAQGDSISWSAPVLPAKQSATLQVTAQIAAGSSDGDVLTNRASLSADQLPLPLNDQAEVTVRQASLSLSKSSDRDSARSGISASGQLGDEVVYRLEYQNTGRIEATAAKIVDVLPPELVFVESLPAPDVTQGQKLVWNLDSLPAGAEGDIFVKARLGNDLREGTVIHNSASITSTTTGTIQSNTSEITVLGTALLSVKKSASSTVVAGGDTLVYDITVSNRGSDNAVNVQVVDTLPDNVTFSSATANGQHSGEALGGTVTWVLSSLAPGDQAVVRATVLVNSDVAQGNAVFNTVTVTGEKTGGGALPSVTDSLSVPVAQQPAFELNYTVSKATVEADFNLVYTIETHNVGNANAIDAVLTATIPAGTTPVSIDGGGRFENGRAIWSTSSLPPTGPISLQFVLKTNEDVAPRTRLVSKANISASNAAPKSDSVTTIVVAEPDLEIIKRGDPQITVGEDLDYRITVSNIGGSVARSVTVTDLLPEGTTYKSAQPEPSAVSGRQLTWALGNVSASNPVVIDLTVATDPQGLPATLNNLVQVTDLTQETEVSSWETLEKAATLLDVTITPDLSTHQPGTSVRYTVTWANAGNIDTTGTVVKASLPIGTTFNTATGGGQLQNGLVEWPIGTLAKGGTGQATFTVDVGSTVSSGTRLKNTAEITANASNPDSDDAVVDVVAVPVLLLAKSVNRSSASMGDTVIYTVTYQNGGGAPLTGITVVDTLPAGLIAKSASDGGVISAGGSEVTWSPPDLAAGGQGSFTLSATVTNADNQTLVNSVTLGSNELPDETATASVTVATEVLPVPIDQRWLWLLATLMGAMVMVRGRYRFGL